MLQILKWNIFSLILRVHLLVSSQWWLLHYPSSQDGGGSHTLWCSLHFEAGYLYCGQDGGGLCTCTHSGSSAPSLQPVDKMAARLSSQQHAPGTFTPSPALPSSTPLPPPAVAQLLERDDTVRRSTILWASPLHMVAKKDGSWRPCSDFQWLNLVTEPDRCTFLTCWTSLTA